MPDFLSKDTSFFKLAAVLSVVSTIYTAVLCSIHKHKSVFVNGILGNIYA